MENSSSLDINIAWKNYCNITDKEDGHKVHVLTVLSAVICALIFLLGPTVNGFVLWIKFFKMEKKYRSILWFHLFFSGFILSLIQLLDMVYFALDLHWPFGVFLCRLSSAIFYFYMFMSALILTLFSVDYYILVFFTARYHFKRTKELASKQVLIIWIFSLGVSVPFFIFQDTYDCQNSIKCVYGIHLNEKVQYQSIVITAFLLGFFIPFLIMISCFTITGLFYHRKKSSRYSITLKLIFLIQTCFVLCWVAHHVLSILTSFTTAKNLSVLLIDKGLNFTKSLASLTSCIFPFLYAFICPQFQNVYSIQSILGKKILGTRRNPTD